MIDILEQAIEDGDIIVVTEAQWEEFEKDE